MYGVLWALLAPSLTLENQLNMTSHKFQIKVMNKLKTHY